MDHKESSKRSIKRPSSSRPDAGREREPDRPPAKKQALPQQPSSAEDIRSAVRGLYQAYQALVDAKGPSEAAFQALLKATAAGDLASRRLAARLVPRFLAHHPEHSEPAAAALIRLHCQQQASDPSCKSLEDLTRQDALAGLGAVLKAARACRAPHGEAAVKLVLDHLFRLLPAAASEEPSEPEEEGEAVLLGSEELQGWVMRQARSRATAPPEVRSVIESALQLLPEDKQLEALRPRPDTHHATPAAAAAAANCSRGTPQQQQQQQQQRLKSSGSLPHYIRQQQNGGLVNGAEPLSRSLSTPGQLERDRSRAGSSKLGAPEPRAQQQQQQQQFPQPPGPICRAEPCLLVLGLPPHISRQELQQTLGAEEAWLGPQQQQQQAGSRGLGSSSSSSACCTFKGVLEAAKAYLRHNGMQRLPHCPPLRLAFCDSLPPGSAKAAAAAASSAQALGYVWATRDAVGDAESITDELRAAGLSLNHVHRVNNAAEPGTLLQTPSAAHAASVVAYLLKKHPQQQQQQGEQEMPPLPPEPPPAADWARQQQQQAVPPLPPGPPPVNYQQQQLERAATGGAGRPASPGLLLQQRQQQQGYVDPGGTANQQPTVGGISGGGWHSMQQQQQQQQWGQRAPPPAGPPGPMPPIAPHPSSLAGGQQQQQQQQQPWQQQQQHLPLQQQGASPGAHGLPPGAAAALARAGSAGAGSPASLQQPFQQQQQQQGRVLWQGSIVKQSVHMCGVACLHPGSSSSMLTSAPEPRGWPDALHVNFRICVGDALEQYAASAPDTRAVRLLLPLHPDGGDATALQSFINYLNGKDRAGMVKLPPLREHGLGPRAVYLIPPKPGVCQQLQVGWDGRAAMLIAVVVPQPSAAGGGPGGSGGGSAHRGYR
ncbi:hypothetical protein OEZ86_008880 [Tetradesmus obliquus]|nr:hypothetical protein OEZ86_008880 [Tetradesmus obliquus]